MKDIKSLYLSAKSSGRQADISAYTEAIQDLIESNPNGYITQLEYIISSDIGLRTVKPFIEKNGFSVAVYDQMYDCLTECIRKCEVFGKDATPYNEMVEYFENFRMKYLNCFMMYENYSMDLDGSYVSTYYGRNEKGEHNRNLIAGMIGRFQEAAIPDALITADLIGDGAVKAVLEYVAHKYAQNNGVIYEWLLTVANDLNSLNESRELISTFSESSISAVVNNLKKRERQLYRESMIMGNDDLVMEYTEDDVEAIRNLIAFKEYQMTWMDEFTERGMKDDDSEKNHDKLSEDSVFDKSVEPKETKHKDNEEKARADAEAKFKKLFESNAMSLQSDIYELYEMLDGVIDEESDALIGFMNKDQPVSEAMWVVNTKNKKDGSIPSYIGDNHDLQYGEAEPKSDTPAASSGDKEPTLDDYRRPSASGNQPAEPLSLPSAYNEPEKQEPSSSSSDSDSSKSAVSDDDKRVINNYYYTYTNSLNRNTHSFNKDNSTRDNHSISTSTDDHSIDTTDDHSKVTHVNSHNKNSTTNKLLPEDDDEKPEDKPEVESSNPWDLDIFAASSAILEKSSDEADSEEKLFKKVFDKDLKDVGKIDDPPKTITIKIGETNMTFDTKVGYGYVNKERITSYGQVPVAVYLYHQNKDDIENDKIGIADEILSWVKTWNKEFGGLDDFDEKDSVDEVLKKFKFNAGKFYFKDRGNLGIDFGTDIDPEHGFGINIDTSLKLTNGGTDVAFESAMVITEDVGDADDNKPKSDHPIKDILTDIDRETTKKQQSAKKKVQDAGNVVRAAVKPVKRTQQWISKMVHNWKDADENSVKERMADPHARSNLFTAIKNAIKYGSIAKAGLLFNPVFLFLSATRGIGKNKREFRIRNEMIGELKTEIAIIDEKIKDASYNGDNAEKYKLMRFKNELNKKLIRVGGNRNIKKMI